MELYKANILYSRSFDEMVVFNDSCIAVEDGKVEGIYESVPDKFKNVKVNDYSGKTIIPAFSDLHVHAPQYEQRGMGMDLLLEDWLNTYTFPEEAKYKDIDYAKAVYDRFSDDLVKNGTFHAVCFATIHREATEYLVKNLEERGIRSFVGKVNMDTSSPSFLCETISESLTETEAFIEHTACNRFSKPILMPRFTPVCSRRLLEGLGKLGRKYHVGLHTHLVESIWEEETARKLFPSFSCDTEVYEALGLMDNGPVIGAHFIFPSENDIRILKKHGGCAVHCPEATVNVIAGIMRVSYLHERGINLAIGTDVGAAPSVKVYRQIAEAVRLSKIKNFYEGEGSPSISFENAFYMATKGASSVFENTGSFDKGCDFDALVIDDLSDEQRRLTPQQNIERFCYCGDERDICAGFIRGKKNNLQG